MKRDLFRLEEVFRHLASRVEQGIPLHIALVESAGTGGDAREAERLVGALKQGESLESAFDKGEGCSWPEQYKSLLIYGERHGGLAVMLRTAADIVVYEQDARASRSLALVYPLFGMAVAILCFFLMAGGGAVVCSQIWGESFPFPEQYRWIASCVGISRRVWLVVGFCSVGVFVAVICFLAEKIKSAGRSAVFGRSRYWLDHAMVARVISRLVRQKMPLPDCIRAGASVTQTAQIAEVLQRVADGAEQGDPVEDASGPLDSLFIEILSQGSESLSDDLFSLAELYTMRMHEAVSRQVARIGIVAFVLFVALVAVVIDFFAAFYAAFLNGIGSL
jgi:type II secretory pathway component PulF